jgi:AcrR family transcriptional regulator
VEEKILHKATDLFLTYGVKSVTMDDIAKELAISKKTIYTFYSTKTKLVEASTSYLFHKINSEIQTICSLEQNAIKELFMVKTLILEHLKNEESSPQYQLQKYYPDLYDSIRQKQFDSIDECISKNLKKGIEAGFYRKDLDINLITRFYFIGVIGIKNIDLFPKNEYGMPYLMKNYLEYHIRAIATEKGIKSLQNILNK